ncbi:ABC transporter ATP-binding protein [Vibrio nitrifigilis]|uniref:ABC transporter ATP-binding protein n=1 Tax=Vibrio nitrifigilis TaxID=2789781 RepID=A0ABS0GH36_9VIBR|nr:ABC transporter ATP-binding protein [Vibrio nitrifigilis]MBF9001714.1 ABC transporter ATP-binding protein [Vibrio nitrifigilis]
MSVDQTVNSSAVIELNSVHFQWPKASRNTLEIETLSVAAGEHLFIKGPSGCGKSTLLGLLTGITQATQGTVNVLQQELTQLRASQRDKFRADNIGYIFQQFNLLPYLSVIENVTLPCQLSSQRKARLKESPERSAYQLLSRLKIPESLLNKPVIELSIGQQQRVAAARALIGEPSLIIADEPTSALDFDTRSTFIDLLLDESDRVNSTLIFVSHDPTLEKRFNRSVYLPDLNRAGGTQ